MRLTLLGTGNAAQVPVYNCSCIACQRARAQAGYRRGPCCALLQFQGEKWLIDSGLTDLTERFTPGELSAVVQTHYHADHAQGLLHLRWGTGMKLPVLGPPDPQGFADLYKHPGILDFSRVLQAFEPVELAPGLQLVPLPLQHSKPTFGYVFQTKEKCFAYLTDTVGLPPDTARFLKGKALDALVLDCSYPPRPQAPRNHNDLTRALDTLAGLPVKLAVLTHIGHEFDAWLMQHPQPFPSHIQLARDGMCVA